MKNGVLIKLWHRIKQYPIIGAPYQVLIGKKKTKKLFKEKSKQVKEYGEEAILLIEMALFQIGISYFIDFGSLLGVIRDHQFIDWDPDIDYAIIIERDFDWSILQDALSTFGFTKIKEWRLEGMITEQTYRLKSLTVDFFGHYIEKNEMVAYVYSRVRGHIYKDDEFGVYSINTPRVYKTKQELVGCATVTVPDNAEEYLASLYNDDWMIPNPNWIAFSGPAYHLMENKIGKPTEFE